MDGLWYRTRSLRAVGLIALTLLAVGSSAGCQTTATVTVRRLINHQAMIDFSGLKEPEMVDAVKINVAPPNSWTALSLKKTSLYTDMHWKSPSGTTGVGVAYLKLPFPLSPKMLLWFAKSQYSSKSNDGGRMIGEWTDELGRAWFEGANDKYHARGFVITHGREAWIVYCGYKTVQPPDAAELGLAARCLDTIVPLPRGTARDTREKLDATLSRSVQPPG
jgi:hypothetical protein